LNPVREAFLTVTVKMTTSHYFLVIFETAFIEGVQDFEYQVFNIDCFGWIIECDLKVRVFHTVKFSLMERIGPSSKD